MKTTIKFTGPNRTPIYGVNDYPPVGEWSESRTPVLCGSGWHVSEVPYLARTLGAEMWVVEVDGACVSDHEKSAYERIRFVRRVEEWDPVAFGYWCTNRATAHADASAAYYAAKYAAKYAKSAAAAAERAAQSDYLLRLAGLKG